ncbi:hypothetical protein B9G98_04434 [Wickerhamiella sorbophila]|uniref:Uncharacterized protein n=1 Tax=Wickerhamiella sorbophila TaxID=45607 RepID=A0A2T0FP98_9ASCO|nr:hypothetical protein B9G98_04434 [Wickerhamiella sorbophila]PRT56814.1 hypothetical protein B9G98_04434 [Wickerhamiella sorbophila]
MKEAQIKWIELVEAYDEAANSRDPDDVEVPAENEGDVSEVDDNAEEVEEAEDTRDEIEDLEQENATREHIPKHCGDLYRSLKPTLAVLDAKTKNAIHKIVVERLGE